MSRVAFASLLGLAFLGCEQIDFERMIEQPSFRPYEASTSFPDGMAMRRPPPGTIPRSRTLAPLELVTGQGEDGPVGYVPVLVDRSLLERGQDRFRIFCASCHGVMGDGSSQVAENMTLRRPPSLHDEDVRAYPPGRLFGVVSSGYGLMPGYEDKLSIQDRWAVVAFVGALQLSQRAELVTLPDAIREEASTWLR
jgi:mono/diheme cytochrome c family protein